MQDRCRVKEPDDGTAAFCLNASLCTEPGAHARNEDYAAIRLISGFGGKAGAVAAIADGVGGANGGRVAAELAVRCFIDGVVGQGGAPDVRDAAMRSLNAVNGWIHAVGGRDPELAGMAATLTALVVRGRRGFLLHIGDSRLYRLRDDNLEALTVDHNYGLPGYRHVLTRAIGAESRVKVDFSEISLSEYDRYLFCTDGVHAGLPVERLRAILAHQTSPDDAARAIVEAALASRGGDNATALVVDVVALPPADLADLWPAYAAKPVLPAPRAGEVVDGFHLERMLSEGPYSYVFEAFDKRANLPIVVKFPKPHSASDAAFRQAFARETWVGTKVRSPFVGKTLEIPEDRKSRVYLIMPFYDGETLERRLTRQPPVSLTTGLDLALKLAKGVASLHRAGVIHRDIKPDNVIIEAQRRNEPTGLKLIDLGVARVPRLDGAPGARTAENGAPPGTPSYMAPELFDGAPGDELSDQFALGVTIYRMFAGAYPYGEIEPFTRPRLGEATLLQKRRPDLPAWLDRAIMRAIAPKPDARYADVLELAFELEHGATRPSAQPAAAHPLYERNPLLFWKAIAAMLLAALMLALLRLATL